MVVGAAGIAQAGTANRSKYGQGYTSSFEATPVGGGCQEENTIGCMSSDSRGDADLAGRSLLEFRKDERGCV